MPIPSPRRRCDRSIRCQGCGTLLARVDDERMTIRRGGMELVTTGRFQTSIVCYMPNCRSLTVFDVASPGSTPSGAPP